MSLYTPSISVLKSFVGNNPFSPWWPTASWYNFFSITEFGFPKNWFAKNTIWFVSGSKKALVFTYSNGLLIPLLGT